MASVFKYFDRLLTFITNNKLIQLFFPLLFTGALGLGGWQIFDMSSRLSEVEKTPERPKLGGSVPSKESIIIRETIDNCKYDHSEIERKLKICLNHVENH